MARPVLLGLSLLLLTSCDGSYQYDITCTLIRPESPGVKLPYEETLNKGDLRLSIRAVPGRTDAVRVVAKMCGFYESPTVEWIQEGYSTKRLPLDKGLERYDFEFSEFRHSNGVVTEVKLAVTFRSKSGSR